MRSGWIKEVQGQFPRYEIIPLKEQRVEGRRGKDVKHRGPFHKRWVSSIREGGNTHGHVIAGPSEGTSHRSDQFTGHTKVAKFDDPFTGQ